MPKPNNLSEFDDELIMQCPKCGAVLAVMLGKVDQDRPCPYCEQGRMGEWSGRLKSCQYQRAAAKS